MASYGICLRVTHTGLAAVSLPLNDIDDGVGWDSGEGKARRAGAAYVGVGNSVDLVYTSDVAKSLEVGTIRSYVDNGHLTVLFVIGSDLSGVLGGAPTGPAGGQLGGTYPNPDVRGIRESGGTELTVGAIANGQFLVRSGTTLIGSTLSTATKTSFFSTDGNSNLGNIRVRAVSDNASYRFNFHVPTDFTALSKAVMVCIPEMAAASVAQDIDLASDYGVVGGAFDVFSETDTTSTYDLSGTGNQWVEIDVSSVLSSLAANTYGGILLTHNSLGGGISYLGLLIEYT